jgi:hypothetical protein
MILPAETLVFIRSKVSNLEPKDQKYFGAGGAHTFPTHHQTSLHLQVVLDISWQFSGYYDMIADR